MFKSLGSPENERLIAWLKANRKSQGLSMRELASRLDVSHSFIGKVEQQERRLDVVEYMQYCKALGVSPAKGLKVISS